ncbi:MAG: hypothetical protein ACYDIE_05305 [Candidatus Krumholzibacteriia bacterium]
MWSRRRIVVGLLLGLLGLTVLFGCRAFTPEVVIVNRPPDTFIVGAPVENWGGYYHFHVYWYGTDSDGAVTKFVWALTDTSIQDPHSLGDEEDQRFNPATNVGTLAIGHYTTRTDTVFDFQIDQGATLAYQKTFHIVAIDDRGAFDRTPARLRFITNALGNPVIRFYRSDTAGVGPLFADFDTIGYGRPFALSWTGTTPNIRSYSPELLAQRDTVPPIDGLFGYKFRLLDNACADAGGDCWQPRHFDATTGDSVSYFGEQTQLRFTNDGSGTEARNVRLASGVHRLLVNTIDMAGVEVPAAKQALNYVVNYDPDTRLLRGERDLFNPSDAKIYPYYRIFYPDGTVTEHPFAEGDTVPDKAYVVFKALGWDDPRDLRIDPLQADVRFQAAFEAEGKYGGQSVFTFATQFSDPTYTPDWVRPAALGGGGADTVGFLVGPFKYTVTMRAVDEWDRRDGTPETFSFVGDFSPCVQCVEVMVGADMPAPDANLDCRDAACAAAVDTIYARIVPSTPVPPDRRAATLLDVIPGAPDLLWYNTKTGAVWLDQPLSTVEPDSMPGYFFEYRLALHGRDSALEPWWPNRPQDRIMSWNYQIVGERDPGNVIQEGGGKDDINFTTFPWALYNPLATPPQPIAIDEDGVWMLRVKFFVPELMMLAGDAAYRTFLQYRYPNWQDVYSLTTRQFGLTTVQVRANDASTCDANKERSRYFYYTKLRVPENHGLLCDGDYPGVAGSIRLADFMRSSAKSTKQFVIKVVPNTGGILP